MTQNQPGVISGIYIAIYIYEYSTKQTQLHLTYEILVCAFMIPNDGMGMKFSQLYYKNTVIRN